MQPQRDRISSAEIDALRVRVSIADVASRHIAWDRRKTSAGRGDYWACCPFHDENSPSFHVREGEGKFKCFGCGESGDVIELLMRLERLSFPDAVRRLGGSDAAGERRYAAPKPTTEEPPDEHKLACAQTIWDDATLLTGSLGETYLRSRGIAAGAASSADIRFHASAPYWGYEPARSKRYPAMVAAIRKPDRTFIGAHVTYLAPDGMGKADVNVARKVFAKKDGGFIRLGPIGERLVVGEGIESALSAAEISGRPSISAVTSENMAKLPIISGVRDWLIAYDRDARQQGYKAGKALADRLRGAGLDVRALPPPNDVKDWNDAAQLRG